ncbi:MAG: hypothetical protein AB7G62_01925 [Magnetospirillum sp.]
MAFELVIVICVGFAAAGILMAVTRPFGLKLGKTVAPAVAALAMVTYQVWSRYTWEDRIAAALGPQEVVLARIDSQSPFDPWSYVVPMVGSMVVLDKGSVLTNPDHPDLRVVTTRLYEQSQETLMLNQFVDCQGKRRALVSSAGADGVPPPEAWIAGGQPAALFAEVCGK